MIEGLDREVHLLDVAVAAGVEPGLEARQREVRLGPVPLRREREGDGEVVAGKLNHVAESIP